MIVSTADATLALDARAELGEGPVWDPATSSLYFVDILRGLVHRYDPATSDVRTYSVNRMVGAIALATANDLVLAVRDGFARLDLSSGRVTTIATVDANSSDLRMNDGKCDAAGRFWAGTMALDERDGAGALYRLDTDGQVRRMVTDVTISNGIDWSNDGRVMYFVDSPTQSVDAFDFDPESGDIANRRSVVSIPAADGVPDGLTVDADGYIWVALWGGGAVHRYAPDGTRDAIVRVPTRYATSCTFGGGDLRDLYITTATIKLSARERADQPSAGGVFRCRPGAVGRAANRFRG